MANVPARREGFSWLTPFLVVREPSKSLAFYQAAFGFEQGDVMTDDSQAINHADLRWQGTVILMLSPEYPDGSRLAPITSGAKPSSLFYVYVPDVDSLFQQAKEAGATVLAEPADMPWGDRVTTLADLDGYHWNFATYVGFGDS